MKTYHSPPRFFHRFFRWYCKPNLRDHIEGDLLELHRERAIAKNQRLADWKFIIDVLGLFRPGIIKTKNEQKEINQQIMFKSYLKIGWRRLARNKGYSLINISGLAIGMTVTLFIGLWIYDELSFDKYHKNHDNISQLWSGMSDPTTSETDGGYAIQYPVADVLRNNYPNYFKHVLMGWWPGDHTVSAANQKFSMNGQFIEPGVQDMLSLKMLQGNGDGLQRQNSIILSKSAAIALFGNNDPINKTLRIDNKMDVLVTGIFEDVPRNSSFSGVRFFAPWSLYVSTNDWIKKAVGDWDNRPFSVYVQLQPGITMAHANAAIKDLYIKNMPADLLSTVIKYKPFVQLVPMNSWHLYAEFKNGRPAGGLIMFVWLFGVIGLFVLLLACINFVNLSTARSEKRAREVGVRKAIGSSKKQLVWQFLSESFLVVLLSFLVSLLLMLLLRHSFNTIADKDIALPFSKPAFWLIAVAFILFTSFLAGIYPAFYLSSFQPVKVLKGVVNFGHLSALRRRVLVVVQFTVSVVLIIGTLVVYQQIQFARNRPVGYDRNSLITVPLDDPGYKGKMELIRTELLNTGVVSSVSGSSNPLTAVWNVTGGYEWPGKEPGLGGEFGTFKISHDFGKTVGWQIIAGRDFSRSFSTDSADAIIINESAVKYMGLKNPVGQKFVDVDEFGKFNRAWTIIGVVKDLVMTSPYKPALQTIFYFDKRPPTLAHIKLKPSIGVSDALVKIKKVMQQVAPDAIFTYQFVNEEYASKFSQEERTGKLSGIFAIFAIFISCLGLSGLASFVAEQRTKEIGIRKVMGASVSTLWQMLSKDFVILVIISCCIAVPLAYFLMSTWLDKYEYHTGMSWWLFVLTSLGAVVITLLTVSFQSIRAARLNPVKSLKSE